MRTPLSNFEGRAQLSILPPLKVPMSSTTAPSSRQIHGSCLCKWIKFTITIPPTADINSHPTHFTSSGKLRATNCHCNTCRRSIGALFGTWAHVPSEFLTISDLAMNTGTYRSSENATRQFCRVCGTSLFSSEDIWRVEPENKEVSVSNMYNRETQGKQRTTVDVSVAAMDTHEVKEWVQILEHAFVEDAMDGGYSITNKSLPMYSFSFSKLILRYSKEPGSEQWSEQKDSKL